MVNSERTLTHCGAAMDPPGDAAPDWQLICQVATAMGYPGFEFDSAAAVFAGEILSSGLPSRTAGPGSAPA